MKRVLLLVIVVFMLSGCVKQEETKELDPNQEYKTVCTYNKETDKDSENYTFIINSKGDEIYHIDITYSYDYFDQETYQKRKDNFYKKDRSNEFYSITFEFNDAEKTEVDRVSADYANATEEDFENYHVHVMDIPGITVKHSNGKYSLESLKEQYGNKGYDCRIDE